jgi:hypothetical protein
VLGFASRQLAEEARARSAELDREGALQLDGAALAYRHGRSRWLKTQAGMSPYHSRHRRRPVEHDRRRAAAQDSPIRTGPPVAADL